ncbi:MAG: hypothetical protein AB7R40_23275 [Nitrospiraceae bacterium]
MAEYQERNTEQEAHADPMDETLAAIVARWEDEDYHGAMCELGAVLGSKEN